MTGLADSEPSCVRICSVRAVYHFCDNLMSKNQTELLKPALQTVLDGLLSIAQSYGTEVMALCLDSIQSLLKVCNRFILQCQLQIGFLPGL